MILSFIGISIFLWMLVGFIVILLVIKYSPADLPDKPADSCDIGKVLIVCTILWPIVVAAYLLVYIHEYMVMKNITFSINFNDLIFKFYVYSSRKLFGAPKE